MIVLQRTGSWYELACTCHRFIVVIGHQTRPLTAAEVRSAVEVILDHAATHPTPVEGPRAA